MNDYKYALEILEKEIKNIIKNSDIQDYIFEKLISELDKTIKTCDNTLNTYYHKKNTINDALKEIDSRYNNNTKVLQENNNLLNKKITDESITLIKEIKENINNLETTKNNTIKRFKEEQTNTTSQTNPLVYNHILKRNKILGQYALYKKNINKRYDSIVNKFSTKIEEKNQNDLAQNNKYMFRYNKANDSIINNFNECLKTSKEKLEQIEKRIITLKEDYDLKLLSLEKIFNTNVININKNLDLTISLNNNQFELEKNGIIAQQKENEEKNNILKSNIIKEFITNIEKNNEQIELLNKNTNNHINFYNKEYFFLIFNIDKEINSINKKNKEEELRIKNLIDEKKIILKKINKIIKKIKEHYKTQYDILQNKKIILEQIKNDEVKKNEYIEEINKVTFNNQLNILKYNFEYTLDSLKKENNIKIKELRSIYDKQRLDILKEYKLKQNEIQKNKEEVLYNINCIEDEIEYTNKIEQQVCINNKSQIDYQLEKNNIYNLLEIEKNKFLKEFNLSRLDLLSNKEDEIYNYHEFIEFSQRDKKNTLININIERSKIDFNHNKKIFSLEIDEEILNEDYNKKKNSLTFNDSITKVKSTSTYHSFNYRKEGLLNEFDLCKTLSHNLILYSYFICNSIGDYQLNETIISKLFKFIVFYIKEIINISHDNSISIISDQINYETGSKYSSLAQSIDEKYESDCKLTNIKKENIKNTLDNYNNAITKFYHEITLLENEKTSIIQKFKKEEISKSFYKKSISSIKQEIKRYHKLIDKNEILIEKFKKDYNRIPIILASFRYDTMNKKRKLQKSQDEEASILIKSSEDISYFYSNFEKAIYNISINDVSDYHTYIYNTSLLYKKLLHKSPTYIKEYYTIIENLTKNVTKKNNKLKKNSNKSFSNNLKAINKNYENRLFDIKHKIAVENNEYNDLVKESNKMIDETIEQYNKIYANKEYDYKKKCDEIDNLIIDNFNSYYSKINSTSSNIEFNISVINKKLDLLDLQNKKQNQNLTTYYITKKNNSLNDLNYKKKIIEQNFAYIPNNCKLQQKRIDLVLKNEITLYNQNKKECHNVFNNNIKNINKETIKKTNYNHNKILILNNILTKNRRHIK